MFQAVLHVCFEGRYGLSNRIRSMAGHYAIAKLLNLKFSFEWHAESSCPGIFSDVMHSKLIGDQSPVLHHLHKGNLIINGISKPTHCGSSTQDIFKAYSSPKISIDMFNKYIKEFYLSLAPCHRISTLVDDFFYSISDELLGVHIRRTDMLNHCEMLGVDLPSDDNLILSIERYLEKKPETKIFLASDNPESEIELKKRYGNKIFFSKKNWDNKLLDNACNPLIQARMSSLDEAVFDLFSLSRCNFIIGTKHSSFSTLAAELGSKEYIRV